MEESLRESLDRIRMQKENLEKQHLMTLERAAQFQNGLNLPLGMTGEQQPSHMSWLQENDGRHLLLQENASLLQQRDIECSTDATLQGFSGYFSTGKQTEVNKQSQEEALNELNQSSCLRLELGGNFPYPSYDLNLLSEKKFKPGAEVNLPEIPVDYQVNNFEPPRPVYDANAQAWASTSGSCGIVMFDDHSYPQQPNQT
ncbi:uncharacterized protein A4U43_C03F120 [Asparagus officinalis]|uniref:MADS-box domain-containing protein n=2 Tax=Asparagus officinalis TaxID=4686 RepID=A0A5P1FBD2_ASPOF|nr:uncharacterized protein A4U43_C03F120 [Asparagus officinalis]